MVLTLSLAYSVNEMRKDDVMVRKLNSCYVMGGARYVFIFKIFIIRIINSNVF
jgi:magnesium-transporting ATPase (P-type)